MEQFNKALVHAPGMGSARGKMLPIVAKIGAQKCPFVPHSGLLPNCSTFILNVLI